MNLKVLYGGLSRENVELIESLIEKSPKNLESSNLGSKVTRVVLRRMLRDSTVSVVLLSENDYNAQSSLSDDRLVCVFDEDSIRNIFESKFGVSRGIKNTPDDFKDNSDEESYTERSAVTGNLSLEIERVPDADVGSEIEDEDDLSWEQVLKNYEKLGSDDVYDDDVEEDEGELEVSSIPSSDDSNSTEDFLNIPSEVLNDSKGSDTSREKALKRTIENLNVQLEEQKQFLLEAVSKNDYHDLRAKFNKLDEEYKVLKSDYDELENENVELDSQLKDIKSKFKDLMLKFSKQSEQIKEYKGVKLSTVKKLERRYPNVEFLVPLSSNSVVKMYEYVSSLSDKFLFIDLTSNSYIDNDLRLKKLVRPSKWLLEGWDYRKVTVESENRENIRVITSVVHEFDSSILLKVDWDNVLGELSFESKVIINIGSIYDDSVLDVLKAVQHGVTVKGFLGDLKRDQRIGKLALQKLEKYKVLASHETADSLNIITDRY